MFDLHLDMVSIICYESGRVLEVKRLILIAESSHTWEDRQESVTTVSALQDGFI